MLSHADVCCKYLYKCFESRTLMMHKYLYMFSSYRLVCGCYYFIYMFRLWLRFKFWSDFGTFGYS